MLLFCIPGGTHDNTSNPPAPPPPKLSTGFTQASTSYPQAAMLARVLHRIPQGKAWVCIRIPIDHNRPH